MTFKQLSKSSTETIADTVGQLAREKVAGLIENEKLASLTAETNAFGWGLDSLEVDGNFIEVTSDEIVCVADVQFSGDQDAELPACGDTISGTVVIRIDDTLEISVEDEELELKRF